MKKISAIIATFFLMATIIFFATAFVQMKLNPALWPMDARLLFVFTSLLLGFAAAAGMASAYDD